MWLTFEVLVLGMFFAYLLALVPAAVVSILKNRWLLLILGFFTFSLGWFYGAVDVAKPESWWDRKFYADGPERGSRAFGQARKKVMIRGGMIAIVATILIGFLAARPTVVVGVDGTSLQNSVGGLFGLADRCEKRESKTWTCFHYDSLSSSDAPYRTTVDWSGCWKANTDGNFADQQLKGCVTIFDHPLLARWMFE